MLPRRIGRSEKAKFSERAEEEEEERKRERTSPVSFQHDPTIYLLLLLPTVLNNCYYLCFYSYPSCQTRATNSFKLAGSDQTEQMAHQLNTDYLRRKLLNPQRQVSFIHCSITPTLVAVHSFLPFPFASAPQSRNLCTLPYYSSITSISPPPRLGLLASTLSLLSQFTILTARTLGLAYFQILHVTSILEFAGYYYSRASGATLVQIILIRLPSFPSKIPSHRAGRKLFIPNTIIHHTQT